MIASAARRRQNQAVIGMAISLVAVFLALNQIAPGGHPTAVRGVDSVGYFAASHSVLFDRDFDYSNEFRRVPPDANIFTLPRPGTGLPGDPWPIGYPLLAVPFLAFGSLVDRFAGHAADGYSSWAMFFYTLANVVFTGAGLVLLFGFLQKSSGLFAGRYSAQFRGWISVFVTGSVLVGTTVGYYAFSPMSHASTFLMASLFLRLWWSARRSHAITAWAGLGFAGGVLSICRWQELVYLAGPILFDLGTLRQWWKPGTVARWFKSRTAYALAAAVCWIPQIIEWKTIYGKFLTIPQGNGFLEFPPRSAFHVLFSSQHGWFIWTPIALLGVIGMFLGARVSAAHFWPWIVVIGLDVSVMASLQKSWSGDEAFGQRSLTSLAPLLAYGVAAALYVSNQWQRKLLAAAVVFCGIFTVLFAVQFRMNWIPREDRLTFAELITDKMRPDRAYHRKAALTRAGRLRDGGDPAGAANVLREAMRLYGEDRFLLAALAEVERSSADIAGAQAAQDRLDNLRHHQVW